MFVSKPDTEKKQICSYVYHINDNAFYLYSTFQDIQMYLKYAKINKDDKYLKIKIATGGKTIKLH